MQPKSLPPNDYNHEPQQQQQYYAVAEDVMKLPLLYHHHHHYYSSRSNTEHSVLSGMYIVHIVIRQGGKDISNCIYDR